MAQIIHKLRTSRSETEAQAFLREVYPFPVVAFAIAGLALGDVAVALAMLASAV